MRQQVRLTLYILASKIGGAKTRIVAGCDEELHERARAMQLEAYDIRAREPYICTIDVPKNVKKAKKVSK